MTNYAHLSQIETTVMTFFVVITNLSAIPTIIIMISKQNLLFQAIIFNMSVLSSFMYHICQIWDIEIFLSQLQWHRLDNIFVITSFELFLLFLFGNIDPQKPLLKYSTIISTILIQEKDPWNFSYSITPILFYGLLAFALRVLNYRSITVVYKVRLLSISILFLLIGTVFFLNGLDDENDYLRFSHGMWHLCVGIFSWYGIEAIQTIPLSSCKSRIILQF